MNTSDEPRPVFRGYWITDEEVYAGVDLEDAIAAYMRDTGFDRASVDEVLDGTEVAPETEIEDEITVAQAMAIDPEAIVKMTLTARQSLSLATRAGVLFCNTEA